MQKIEQRIYQADRAREVLENEAFIGAMSDIKSEITEQWMKSPARDQEGREKLWLMLSLMSKLEATLKTTFDSGKLAKLDLEHKRTMQERLKDALR